MRHSDDPSGSVPAPQEVELKLDLPARDNRRWDVRKLVGQMAGGAGTTRQLVSRYYDTEDRALRRDGYVLRVRHDGDRRIQTLKADGTLLQRPEWEAEIDRDEPDLGRIEGLSERAVLEAAGPLVPVFETSIDRTVWAVSRGLSEVEVALDEGQIVGGSTSTPVREIELELKGGTLADLFGLALDLAASGRVKIGVKTKSERGYALLAETAAAPMKAEPIPLRRRMTAGAAFQVIARSCIRHFRVNETRLLSEADEGSLHQARVAIRRLRSAFSLFKPAIAGPEANALAGELRSLSQSLGDARNLDVYRDRVLAAEATRQPDGPSLGELLARIDADRSRAYAAVARHLESKRSRLLMVRLLAFVEAGPWLVDPGNAKRRDEPIRRFAERTLDKRSRRVRSAGKHLDRLDPEARHDVRIAAKKLRYAGEFFAGLDRGRKAKQRRRAYLSTLEQLQDQLGELNDLTTGQARAEAIARGGGGELVFAAEHIAGLQAGQEQAGLEAAATAFRRFRRALPCW